ncbi:hypothetical protein [Chitinimonas sp.]|uniref:hypothetical protein n=1 Tax=Chitinimonas sp. TaxID=1934313 RepID=UPI002F956FFD
MDLDAYAPPKAVLNTGLEGGQAGELAAATPFFVVGKRKFVLLFLATLGTYRIYWFYKQWQAYKRVHGGSIWPVLRAIFTIFFAHSLFEAADREALRRGVRIGWEPRSLASTYVVVAIVSSVLDRLSNKDIGSPYTDILSLICLPIMCSVLVSAQGAINRACGDPEGEGNSKLTWANYIWLVIGALMWLVIGYGFYAIYTGAAN